MDQKNILLSALGVGVGLGLSKWAGYSSSPPDRVTVDQIERELLKLVVDGKESKVTFDQFPYYLSNQTWLLLTSAAYVHLKHLEVSKYTRNLSPASRTILLSGPAELYLQMLAKALAHHFEAKMLLLDVSDFSLKMQSKYGFAKKDPSFRRSISEVTLERMSSLLGTISKLPSREDARVSYRLFVKENSAEVENETNTIVHQEKGSPRFLYGNYFNVEERKIVSYIFSNVKQFLEVHKQHRRSLHLVFKNVPTATGNLALGNSTGTLCWQRRGFDINSRDMEGASDPPKHCRNQSSSTNMSGISPQCSFHEGRTALGKHVSCWSLDEELFLESLFKVLVSVSETSSIILYIRDVERLLLQSENLYKLFDRMLKKCSGSILILGSRMLHQDHDCGEIDNRLARLFPYNIEIKPPEDESHLVSWKTQLEEDIMVILFQDNRNHIATVLAANDLECHDLGSICHADTMVISNYIEEIVLSAISYHLTNNKDPEYQDGKLVISSKSLSHGLSIFQERKGGGKGTPKRGTNAESSKGPEGAEITGTKPDAKSETLTPGNKSEMEKSVRSSKKDGENPPSSKAQEISPDNEFEKRLRSEVIPAHEVGVTFADIGALDEIKESLQELVMLPLRRPDLFTGGLLKPCRGILLFGPPGTGKTMLAKAIANEAGASFINVSISTITSKWFGEDEKNVRALFTLAAKVSPTIIFVDEVDSMLGQRTTIGEHEAMRKIKNEFMSRWDGLLTNPGERILVLAATNRPFDLDEAIIRRFERRIMVGLPSAGSREIILKTLLGKEKVENFDFKELAAMTEGYSGSDLKNLCITAAYRPVRELIHQERIKDMKKKQRVEEGQSSEDASDSKEEDREERVITLRPLNMEDMKQAKNQVAASFAAEGYVMSELKQWNDLYGQGGSRKKQQLTYFL